MVDKDDRLLTALDASLYLRITAELLFQFTKKGFATTSGLRSLKTIEHEGKTHFSERELTEFDQLIGGYWCAPGQPRPNIPKAILDHLRAESLNQCSRCGSGIGVDTAHIVPWAVSRSHHPHNLIRICSSCHREHDNQQSLSTDELNKIKQRLIDRTCARLKKGNQKSLSILRPPNKSKQFVGREKQLKELTNALQLGESVMIRGVGGIGKSELLLQAFSCIETGRTVLWCNVEEYRTATELEAALRGSLSENGSACSESELPSRLDDIQACLVLDGIEQTYLDRIDEFEDALTRLQRHTFNTQFVITSQLKLYRFSVDNHINLTGIDIPSAKSLLRKASVSYDTSSSTEDITELLRLCDGHPLTLRFAGMLVEYYGGITNAISAIKKNGAKSIRLPAQNQHNRQTSLELCLHTAYSTLSKDSRKLLWYLSLAPSGVYNLYIKDGLIEIENIVEELASLRQWHFVEITSENNAQRRTRILAPVRQFIADKGKVEEPELFEEIVRNAVDNFSMIMAVLEIKYDTPEDTPLVMHRYQVELPNFLNILELAKTRENDQRVVQTALKIVRSLMRYFFIFRMPELGANVMFEAVELAIKTDNTEDASVLISQFMAIVSRNYDDSLIAKGLDLVTCLESKIDSEEQLANLYLSRAMAAQSLGEFSEAELYSRRAYKCYCALLRSSNKCIPKKKCNDSHNDISNALGILGLSLLSQNKYSKAGKAYRHSLLHERGSSIGVNRGQTLHQLGNCESYQGNYKSAVKLYFDAALIFHYVEMAEYLSNAFGELGYALLDAYDPEIINRLEEEHIDHLLIDLTAEFQRIFNPSTPLDHQQCIQLIRKMFGAIVVVSLAERGVKLKEFFSSLYESNFKKIGDQIYNGQRRQDELFPFLMVNLMSNLGMLIAQGETDYTTTGDISHDTTGGLLSITCEAHEWAHDVMRLTDWLSIYFTRRWEYKGINADRLRNFVKNYQDDVVDYLDLER